MAPGVPEVMVDTVVRVDTEATAEAAGTAAIVRASSRRVKGSSRGPWITAIATAVAARDTASSTAAAEFRVDMWGRIWSR